MSRLGKSVKCRRCGEHTHDYDDETGEYWCGTCDTEADV